MPFNFPDPAVSTTATNPVTGAIYQWKDDPGKWVLTGGAAEKATPPVTIDLLPPENPQKGDLWIHEESLIEYAWDGTQWFEVGSSCGGDTTEEEEEQVFNIPFVNSYKLVSPDDFTGEAGTATLETDAYAAGDDSYLSPAVQIARFAELDLNGRKHEKVNTNESFELSPTTYDASESSPYAYGKFEVTNVLISNGYTVDYDSGRAFKFIEGDTIYYRPAFTGEYVKKKGGDTMEGPLKVSGGRSPNADGIVSTVEVLNVDSGQNSSLNLQWKGQNKVYIGDAQVSFIPDIKFNNSNHRIFAGANKKGFLFGSDGVFYEGDYTANAHIATKKNVEEAFLFDITDPDSNKFVKVTGDEMTGDLDMTGNLITNLSDAQDDADAVPYGQVKRELTNKFEELTANLAQGTYRAVTDPDPLSNGNFTTRTGNSYNNITEQLTELRFNKDAGDGAAVDFTQLNIGDYIRLAKGTDIWQFRVDVAPILDATTNYYVIEISRPTGPDFLTTGEGYQLSFFSISGGSVDLDDYVKKAGDTMTGELKITQPAESKLTLTGNRTSTSNSVATVSFLNTSAASQPGYLTYRSDGTSNPFFKFNESIDLNNKQIKRLGSINFGNVGTVKANDNQKMVIRNGANSNDGNSHVQIERPPNTRRGFAIRGYDDTNTEKDIFYSFTNASGGDAVNYVGKMDGPTNILNRVAIEELISAATNNNPAGETFISHGPWHFAGVGLAVGAGQWTSDAAGLKQIRQLTFHNKDNNGEDIVWSDLQVGEVITIVQQGNFSNANGDSDGWAIVNYEVTDITTFSAATVIDVSAHWSVLVFSSGLVQYNPSENWGFLIDTDTYVLESQPATLNNVVQMAKKTPAGPAFNVYKMSTGTSEGFSGVGKGYFVCNGNHQTPDKFIFSGDDWYGNGHKWGANTINCPNSNLEFYRKNADGTLCLCRIYSFNLIQSFGNGSKFEIRNITPVYTATNGTSTIPSPGVMATGENYLARFNISLGTTPYTIDAEDDTHWGFHRLEEIGEPVDATDAATKAYVDQAIGGNNKLVPVVDITGTTVPELAWQGSSTGFEQGDGYYPVNENGGRTFSNYGYGVWISDALMDRTVMQSSGNLISAVLSPLENLLNSSFSFYSYNTIYDERVAELYRKEIGGYKGWVVIWAGNKNIRISGGVNRMYFINMFTSYGSAGYLPMDDTEVTTMTENLVKNVSAVIGAATSSVTENYAYAVNASGQTTGASYYGLFVPYKVFITNNKALNSVVTFNRGFKFDAAQVGKIKNNGSYSYDRTPTQVFHNHVINNVEGVWFQWANYVSATSSSYRSWSFDITDGVSYSIATPKPGAGLDHSIPDNPAPGS